MGTPPGLANSKPGQTELLQIFTSNWNLSELEPNKKPWTFDHRTSSPSYNIFSIEFHLNSELMGSSQIIIKIWCDFFSKSNSIVLFPSRFAVLFTFYFLRFALLELKLQLQKRTTFDFVPHQSRLNFYEVGWTSWLILIQNKHCFCKKILVHWGTMSEQQMEWKLNAFELLHSWWTYKV